MFGHNCVVLVMFEGEMNIFGDVGGHEFLHSQ